MNDSADAFAPAAWIEIARESAAQGFDMPSENRACSLLRLLVASKPGGRILELGTGTGLATAWLAAGLGESAQPVSVDVDPKWQSIARRRLGDDPRVEFVLSDGLDFLRAQPPASFDLIFADAMPGKYEGLHDALSRVKVGGFYVGDDMLPQANWPEGQQARADGLIAELSALDGWTTTVLAWGSGLVLAVRRH
jgi:predicted O-methyltransferase YrrM